MLIQSDDKVIHATKGIARTVETLCGKAYNLAHVDIIHPEDIPSGTLCQECVIAGRKSVITNN